MNVQKKSFLMVGFISTSFEKSQSSLGHTGSCQRWLVQSHPMDMYSRNESFPGGAFDFLNVFLEALLSMMAAATEKTCPGSNCSSGSTIAGNEEVLKIIDWTAYLGGVSQRVLGRHRYQLLSSSEFRYIYPEDSSCDSIYQTNHRDRRRII